MKSTPTSILAHAIYMIIVNGMVLMFIPTVMLDLFGFSYSEPLWSFRMIGMLAFCFGIYYAIIARQQIKSFYGWTVLIRYFAALFMVVLWLLGEVEIMILFIAGIDALGATWTWWTMGFPISLARG
jgi:hypothetical protein